jgi:hypothetical protein
MARITPASKIGVGSGASRWPFGLVSCATFLPIALSSGVPTSGSEGVLAVPAVVAPEAATASTLTLQQIKDQLVQGFRAAGRSDLANMVNTEDFYTWIKQESGWNPRAVSPPDNQGLRNDGLFQIWRGHPFDRDGQVSRMSPKQQAETVAKYFPDLTPQKIHEYAAEIRAGTYKGWG